MEWEGSNSHDYFAPVVKKDGNVVGRVPRELHYNFPIRIIEVPDNRGSDNRISTVVLILMCYLFVFLLCI